MIKELIMLNVIIYLIIAFIWYLIFTYQFTMRINSEATGEREIAKGFRLFKMCLCWIKVIPLIIKQINRNNEEE